MTQLDEVDMDHVEFDNQENDNNGKGEGQSGSVTQIQSADADYYTIVDTEDWPIAGLVVLLDRRHQAVRSELHLYEDSERQNEYALRQAESILANQYYSADLVQLQVMQSYPWRETLEIQANAAVPAETDVMAFVNRYWQYILGGGAILILILFIWLISSFFGSAEDPTPAVVDVPVEASVGEESVAPADSVNPSAANTSGETVLTGSQTNDLQPSQNANPNLAVGQRVRVAPGLAASLVSEPVPDQDKVVGVLNAGQEATIFDGPVWTAGDRDTIVWWRVRLDNGLEAWVPANTSDHTILAPVP